jgi:hypothetical protein
MANAKTNKAEQKLFDIAKIAAGEVLKEYTTEQERKFKSFAFKNTKLLLENYIKLRDHIVNAKDNREDISFDDLNLSELVDSKALSQEEVEEQETDFYNKLMQDIEPELFIESIRRSRCRTIIMVAHIEANIKLLSIRAKDKNEHHKFEVLKKAYFDGISFEELAVDNHCDVTTARRWANDMIRQLSVLLFGVNGIQLK